MALRSETRSLYAAVNERWLTDALFHAEVERAVLITDPPGEAFRNAARFAVAVALDLRDRSLQDKGGSDGG